MKIEIAYSNRDCHGIILTLDGKTADFSDFGYLEEVGETPDYGCAERHYHGKFSTPEVLAKYGISEDEYATIVDHLRGEVFFGSCDECS